MKVGILVSGVKPLGILQVMLRDGMKQRGLLVASGLN